MLVLLIKQVKIIETSIGNSLSDISSYSLLQVISEVATLIYVYIHLKITLKKAARILLRYPVLTCVLARSKHGTHANSSTVRNLKLSNGLDSVMPGAFTVILNPLRASDALRHYRLIPNDALRHYRLIPDDALRHFSGGVLHSPVMDLFTDLC